jgi:hypothetical protein
MLKFDICHGDYNESARLTGWAPGRLVFSWVATKRDRFTGLRRETKRVVLHQQKPATAIYSGSIELVPICSISVRLILSIWSNL